MKFETFQSYVNAINFGKDLPEAVYLHKSALEHVQKELVAVVIGVAKALKISDGEWDIVKLFKRDFKLSYLSYPDFFDYPYPSLKKSHVVDLNAKTNRIASYVDSENPPILHRRELFVHPSDPKVRGFQIFTTEGENLSLYENTRIIGTFQGWNKVIKRSGHTLDERGHLIRLVLESANTNAQETQSGIHRYKTAISRDKLSVPMFTLARLGYLNGDYSILDYGCGKGDDIHELEAHEIDCIGWDPVLRPDTALERCDIVNLGYVINVIEDKGERSETICEAYKLCAKLVVISAMLGNETVYERYRPYKDGVITKSNTFQKYYYQPELKQYIESTLGEEAIAAAPGLFFVFRDKLEQQKFLLERQRTRFQWRQISSGVRKKEKIKITKDKFEKNKELLSDFWFCCLDQGRIALSDEFEFSEQLRHVFGSSQKSLAVCLAYFDASDFGRAESSRKDDLLVYFSLDHFGKRDVYRRMPIGLQRDVKYHFGLYSVAREKSKELLFSVSDPEVINDACCLAHSHLPASYFVESDFLIFHRQYLNACPKELRTYIGCALQLYGDLDAVDLIKVHIRSGKVTLMLYENYHNEPIPYLQERIKIRLRDQEIDFFDYVHEYRPQPLIGKSRYLAGDDPMYKKQKIFDQKLAVAIGEAFDEDHLSAERLDSLLKINNLEIRKYSLVKAKL